MPCNDVAEVIRVVIDENDCLKDYAFNKKSCGQGVGAANLLIEGVRGYPVEWFLDVDAGAFLDDNPTDHELEEFLFLKHLFAIQSALEVLVGKAAGGPKDACAVADIVCDIDSGDTVIDAQIPVELMTEKIQSCGACKGCGKKSKVASV
jgi:hypothetical protein